MNFTINIRTDKKVRDDAKKVFDKMGISTSAAINLFLRNVIAEQRLPFTPSAKPRKQSESIIEEKIQTPEIKKKKSFFEKIWK